jgi:hypothetical protein
MQYNAPGGFTGEYAGIESPNAPIDAVEVVLRNMLKLNVKNK